MSSQGLKTGYDADLLINRPREDWEFRLDFLEGFRDWTRTAEDSLFDGVNSGPCVVEGILAGLSLGLELGDFAVDGSTTGVDGVVATLLSEGIKPQLCFAGDDSFDVQGDGISSDDVIGHLVNVEVIWSCEKLVWARVGVCSRSYDAVGLDDEFHD